MSAPGLRDQLLRLEVALASRDQGVVEGGLMTLITDDFVEFGSSGRVQTYESIQDSIEHVPTVPVTVVDFEIAELANGVVLATYIAEGFNRCSIWLRRNGRWQVRFHQGTRRPG